jgi:hypothetical protein
MFRTFASLLVAAAAILTAPPALAAGELDGIPQTTSGFQQRIGSDTTGGPTGPSAPGRGRFGWAGVGYYNAGSSGFFGFNLGGAYDILPVAPDLPLAVIGNVGLAFGDLVMLPISVGAAVHYDRLPFSLLGGATFTLVPHTEGSGTPVGLGLLGMITYPMPQIRQGISAMAQIQYHFLDDDFSLFVLDVGLTMAF